MFRLCLIVLVMLEVRAMASEESCYITDKIAGVALAGAAGLQASRLTGCQAVANNRLLAPGS